MSSCVQTFDWYCIWTFTCPLHFSLLCVINKYYTGVLGF
jgi:hypothetical protein